MEKNLVIKAIITGTSNKEEGDFKNGCKTIYFKPTDEYVQQAKDFGLKQYTTKDDKVEYFVANCASSGIAVYKEGKKVSELDGSVNGANFNTVVSNEDNEVVSEHVVGLSFFKGHKKGNDFVRMNAILGSVNLLQAQNPFEKIENDFDIDFESLPF